MTCWCFMSCSGLKGLPGGDSPGAWLIIPACQLALNLSFGMINLCRSSSNLVVSVPQDLATRSKEYFGG